MVSAYPDTPSGKPAGVYDGMEAIAYNGNEKKEIGRQRHPSVASRLFLEGVIMDAQTRRWLIALLIGIGLFLIGIVQTLQPVSSKLGP